MVATAAVAISSATTTTAAHTHPDGPFDSPDAVAATPAVVGDEALTGADEELIELIARDGSGKLGDVAG